MADKVTVDWKGDMQFESDNPREGNHTVTMDASPDNGGHNSGLGPKAMMLSSLAGCSGLDIVSVLKKMKASPEDFKMEVFGELTEEHPKYYHKVEVKYHFYGSDLNESKINKAVDLSVEKYCGVMEMFRRFSDVKTSIHLHKN
jgi:putative redox protein